VPEDILPLLETLTTAGQIHIQTNAGQTSESRMQQALGGQAGLPVTNAQELNSLIKINAKFSTLKTRKYIRLADTNEGQRTICPIAYLDGDLSGKHPRLCIQLIIVTYMSLPGDTSECILMRFETPEGNDPAGTGKHDYYHSQLCTELRIDGPGNTFTVPNCVSWSALSCPAWPMDATTPLHLLCCVIFALYGKNVGVRILRTAYGDDLEKLIKGMHLLFSSPAAPRPAIRKVGKKPRKSKGL
jgi:hypothetical protein